MNKIIKQHRACIFALLSTYTLLYMAGVIMHSTILMGRLANDGKVGQGIFTASIHPEWPHRQCVGLAYTWTRVRVSVGAASLVICRPRSTPCNTWSSGGIAHESGGTTSQLYLPSQMPLSVAGCGRLQLGVPHWATSKYYCK